MKASTSCVLQFWTACCLLSFYPFPSVSEQVTDPLAKALPIAERQYRAAEKSWVQFDCDAFALPINARSVNERTIQEANSCPVLLLEAPRTYQHFYPIILVHTPSTPFVLLVNFYRTDTTPNRISRFIDLLDRRQKSRWAAVSLPEIREPVVAPCIPAPVNQC